MHPPPVQTRIALVRILNDLAEDDFFGVITFDSQIFQWKRELVQANQANLESAKTFARNIKDNGGEGSGVFPLFGVFESCKTSTVASPPTSPLLCSFQPLTSMQPF